MKKNEIIDLYDLMMEQLRDLYDGVDRKMIFLEEAVDISDSDELDELILVQLRQSKHQKERLQHVFKILNESPKGEYCTGIKALIKSSMGLAKRCEIPEVRDASLITSIQHINHYEVAGYGTSIAYAKVLEQHDVAEPLLNNLRETKDADIWLSELAEKDINRSATWNALVVAVEKARTV
jgi:ferritin-like metal-binding protein YciE